MYLQTLENSWSHQREKLQAKKWQNLKTSFSCCVVIATNYSLYIMYLRAQVSLLRCINRIRKIVTETLVE